MSEPTAKSLNPKVTLVVHPETDSQRALWVVWADRPGSRAHALAKAKAAHGDAPLGWLDHATNTIEPIAAAA